MSTTREQMQGMRRAELIDGYAAALDKLDRLDDGASEALLRMIALAQRFEARGDISSEAIPSEIRTAIKGHNHGPREYQDRDGSWHPFTMDRWRPEP